MSGIRGAAYAFERGPDATGALSQSELVLGDKRADETPHRHRARAVWPYAGRMIEECQCGWVRDQADPAGRWTWARDQL